MIVFKTSYTYKILNTIIYEFYVLGSTLQWPDGRASDCEMRGHGFDPQDTGEYRESSGSIFT